MAVLADTELQPAVAAECLALAHLLEDLPPSSWDTQSLCAGWRVREVVAHLTMPARYPTPRFILELLKARGNFTRMADRCARRDATLPSQSFVAALRGQTMHTWKPPGGGYKGALVHTVIHSLDVTVPLSIHRQFADERIRVVLDGLTDRSSLKYFKVDVTGIELHADDLDWTFGSGEALTGSAADLALILCGRALPAGRLHGEPAMRFTATRA
jgi:uncharacterized protein (TIGR03083 family)